ncbi:hypothetical protein F5890DRAFT_1554718 [Lentinula detonsa]|uniref:Uncharacterized protein n=1 Tax=Lentinula detonsa TaxID=2804962 RepID=A0AA38UTK4_9AGAR|nr:hypothetical protein F5890DRAFT_1554718 [Lentinula detonsa]
MIDEVRGAILPFLIAIGGVYGLVLVLLGWKLGCWHFFKYHSCIPEIEKMGTTPSLGQKPGGTVVICGGSIAGLLAAQVCSDFFKYVIIVEPEQWLTSEDVPLPTWLADHLLS